MTAISPTHTLAPAPRTRSPLAHVSLMLFGDLISTLLFAGVYAVTHGLLASYVVALAAGVVGLVWTLSKGERVGVIQGLSFLMVVVFGGAALVTHDPRFVMLKPTLIYAAVGVAMLKRGWMTRYLPPIALVHAEDVSDRFGYAWAAVMFATAAVNLALVQGGDVRLWAGFLAIAPLASKITLSALQYVVTRGVVISRRRASAA